MELFAESLILIDLHWIRPQLWGLLNKAQLQWSSRTKFFKSKGQHSFSLSQKSKLTSTKRYVPLNGFWLQESGGDVFLQWLCKSIIQSLIMPWYRIETIWFRLDKKVLLWHKVLPWQKGQDNNKNNNADPDKKAATTTTTTTTSTLTKSPPQQQQHQPWQKGRHNQLPSYSGRHRIFLELVDLLVSQAPCTPRKE